MDYVQDANEEGRRLYPPQEALDKKYPSNTYPARLRIGSAGSKIDPVTPTVNFPNDWGSAYNPQMPFNKPHSWLDFTRDIGPRTHVPANTTCLMKLSVPNVRNQQHPGRYAYQHAVLYLSRNINPADPNEGWDDQYMMLVTPHGRLFPDYLNWEWQQIGPYSTPVRVGVGGYCTLDFSTPTSPNPYERIVEDTSLAVECTPYQMGYHFRIGFGIALRDRIVRDNPSLGDKIVEVALLYPHPIPVPAS